MGDGGRLIVKYTLPGPGAVTRNLRFRGAYGFNGRCFRVGNSEDQVVYLRRAVMAIRNAIGSAINDRGDLVWGASESSPVVSSTESELA
jgi:hypothetical protein